MNENSKVERLKVVDDRSLFIDQLHRWRKILKSLFLPNELFFRINLNKKSYIFPELTFFNELFKNDLKTNQFKFLLNDWKKNKMGRTNEQTKWKQAEHAHLYLLQNNGWTMATMEKTALSRIFLEFDILCLQWEKLMIKQLI